MPDEVRYLIYLDGEPVFEISVGTAEGWEMHEEDLELVAEQFLANVMPAGDWDVRWARLMDSSR